MPANASAELRAIAGHLRAAGDRGNTNALRRGLRAAAAPMPAAVKQAAMAKLPHTGGLNQHVANQKVTVRVRLSARTTDVRLTTSAPDSLWTDSGYVRHKVWGRWLPNIPTQQIPQAAGWWSDTLRAKSVAVTPALLVEIERVRAMIMAL